MMMMMMMICDADGRDERSWGWGGGGGVCGGEGAESCGSGEDLISGCHSATARRSNNLGSGRPLRPLQPLKPLRSTK